MTVAAVVNILAFAENSEDAEDEHTRWVGSYYKSKEDNYSLRYALNQIDNCRAEIISYGEEKFQSAAREYMNSPRRLSEEIEALLDGTPATLPGGEAPKEEAYEEAAVGKKHPQLTHRQVLIFVNQYLNLDLKECNQTKLAELLALIMGGNPGSIRTSIKRLAALDEDTDEYKDDVRLLAELLDPLKPSLATRLRNHAEP
ncbi:MAG: hypothetical protein J6M53_03995 [Bacteroidaceae bacterium]|nr:hypothetical protein [Bacteroidaceae bacterium]